MTTDKALIRECKKLANCQKLVKESEKETVEGLIKRYEDACEISRQSNKQRAAEWSLKAFDRGRELQRWFEAVTGRPWIDQQYIPKHRRA